MSGKEGGRIVRIAPRGTVPGHRGLQGCELGEDEERRRRRTGRSRRRCRRRIVHRVGLVVVILGLLAGAMALSLHRGATVARAELFDARASMRAFVAAIAQGDAEAAADRLTAARASVDDARQATSGPVWRFASRVPVAGRSPRIVQQVVGVARASVRLSERANDAVPELFSEAGDGLQVTAGAFDVGRLELTADALDRLPVDALASARTALASTSTSAVPGVLLEARQDALDLADEALTAVGNAETLLGVLPEFLGGSRERRYLLAVQSSAELRGTGGLLGYVGVLAVDRGRMRLADTGIVDPTARDTGPADGPAGLTELGGKLDQPVPTSEAFRDRYGDVAANALFSNVNVDPDLPTTGPVVLDLYAGYTGHELDGLIALDPVGMGTILSAIGSIELPTGGLEDSGGLPTTVAAGDVARITTIDVYEAFGSGRSHERAAYFDALSRGAFERIFAGSWAALPVVRRLGEAAAGRHVQLFSRDEAEQAAFEKLGVAGALPVPEDADLVAVTANNAVGGKQDVHVGHHLWLGVVLSGVQPANRGLRSWRTADLRVEVENPLPTSGMDEYIIGNCLTNQVRNACFEGPPGVNRTWFTVWTVPPTSPTSVTASDGTTPAVIVDDIHGHRALDRSMETPSGGRNHFDVELAGDVELREEDGDLVYELILWRQAKAIPDHWDVTVAPPPGWRVAEVVVSGGGDGQGMGVAGDGSPLRGAAEGEVAVVRGATTQDARIEVRFTRPWADRFRAWLRQPVF